MKSKYIIFLVLLLVSVAVNIGFIFTTGLGKSESVDIPPHLEKQYEYLSQRVLLENSRDILIHFTPLRQQLWDLIQKDYANDVALYFEYLPTGTSIGVNDRTEFYIASLLKVPVVMSYFHHNEQANITNDPVVTMESRHVDKDYGGLWKEGVGKSISLGRAVEAALTESDNTAFNLLNEYVEQDDLDFVFEGLDLLVKYQKQDKQTIMTVKGYSSIFKALYYSALLSKDHSQKILDLLTQSTFTDKIPAGIPDTIPVAHKIGVYNTPGLQTFSDCGIVYVPRRPYLLCMASRSDEKTAIDRMKTLSKVIYDYVAVVQLSPEQSKQQ